jgi:hypothetical protein
MPPGASTASVGQSMKARRRRKVLCHRRLARLCHSPSRFPTRSLARVPRLGLGSGGFIRGKPTNKYTHPPLNRQTTPTNQKTTNKQTNERTKKKSNKIINRIASRQTELKYTTAYRSIQYGPNEIEHFNSTYRDSTWKPSIRTIKNLSTHPLSHQQTPALPTLRHEPTTNPTPTQHQPTTNPPPTSQPLINPTTSSPPTHYQLIFNPLHSTSRSPPVYSPDPKEPDLDPPPDPEPINQTHPTSTNVPIIHSRDASNRMTGNPTTSTDNWFSH